MPITLHASHAQPAEISRIAAVAEDSELRVRELRLKAVEVLGDERKAQAWLEAENPWLADRRPVDVAGDSGDGFEEAYAVLGRIEYGLYS